MNYVNKDYLVKYLSNMSETDLDWIKEELESAGYLKNKVPNIQQLALYCTEYLEHKIDRIIGETGLYDVDTLKLFNK